MRRVRSARMLSDSIAVADRVVNEQAGSGQANPRGVQRIMYTHTYPPQTIISRNGSPGGGLPSREGSFGSLPGSNSPGGRSFSTIFMQPWTKADQRRREVEALNNLQTVQARRKGWMDVMSNSGRNFQVPMPSFAQRMPDRQPDFNGQPYMNGGQQYLSHEAAEWGNGVESSSVQPPNTPKSPMHFALEKRISGLQEPGSPTGRRGSTHLGPSPGAINPNTDRNLMRQLIDLENTLKTEREARLRHEEALSMRCSLLSDELSNLQRRYTDLQAGSITSPARKFSVVDSEAADQLGELNRRYSALGPEVDQTSFTRRYSAPDSEPPSPMNRRYSVLSSDPGTPASSRARRSLVPMILEETPRTDRTGSISYQRSARGSIFIQDEDVRVSATLVPTWTIAPSERKAPAFPFLQSHPKPSPLSPHRLEERLFSDSVAPTPKHSAGGAGYPESVPPTPQDVGKEAPPGPRTPPRASPHEAPLHRVGSMMDGGWRTSDWGPQAAWRGAAPAPAMRASSGVTNDGWRAPHDAAVMRSSTSMLDAYDGEGAWQHQHGARSVSQPGTMSTVHRSRFAALERPPRQPVQSVERMISTVPTYAGAPSVSYSHAAVAGASLYPSSTVLGGARPLRQDTSPPQRAQQLAYAPSAAAASSSKVLLVSRASKNEMLGGYPTPLKKAIEFTDQLKRPDPRPRSGSFVGTPWQVGETQQRLEAAAHRLQLSRSMPEKSWAEPAPAPGMVGLLLQHCNFGSGIQVAQVQPGLPAKLDGTIRAGDVLTLIEDWNVAGKTVPEVQRALDGREGSIVLLTLVRFMPHPVPYSVRIRRSATPLLGHIAGAYRGFA